MTLDELLAAWAAGNQLTDAQSAALRAQILATNSDEADVEWLWDMLRPVTRLLDGPHRLQDMLARPYLRLA
jgi:hypothetical protein